MSKFRDDQVNQLKSFLFKIIEYSYQRRKNPMEAYSDDIYNIKFLKILQFFTTKARINPKMYEELFNSFKDSLMNLERDKIENYDKSDYTILKET